VQPRYSVQPRRTDWNTTVFDVVDTRDGSVCYLLTDIEWQETAAIRCRVLNQGYETILALRAAIA